MHVSLLLQFVVGSTPKWRRMTGLMQNMLLMSICKRATVQFVTW